MKQRTTTGTTTPIAILAPVDSVFDVPPTLSLDAVEGAVEATDPVNDVDPVADIIVDDAAVGRGLVCVGDDV